MSIAEEGLRCLGRLGHRRQRTELQAEIYRQRTAIRLARTQLTELSREQPELRPTRAPRTRLEPESLVRTRPRERDLGLEL